MKRSKSKTAKKKTSAANKAPGGRPSLYTARLAAEICAQIETGKSLVDVAAISGMPKRDAIYAWLDQHKEFADMYVRAREIRADRMAESLLEIADDGRNDWMEEFDKDGESLGWKLNGEHVQRSKLRVDARKWLLAKMAPRKYGDKIQHSNDPDNPLPPPAGVTVIDYAQLRERIKGKPEEPPDHD